MGQQVLAIGGAIVGAVVGYFVGNPVYGAELGFALGSVSGSLLYPTKIDGPHTKNVMAMQANYGAVLPIVYGNARIGTTLIWEVPIQEVGTTQGGKGSSPQVTSFSYNATFAVALCEGPINGVRRIWANGILVFDVSSTATSATLIASNQFFASHCTLYLGTTTQAADPTMQAYLGAANTPAYRGTAYLVFRHMPLEAFGNVLPSINVEIVTSGAGTSGTLVKVWENDAVGSPTPWGTFSIEPTISYGSPQIRIIDRYGTGGPASTDGIVTLIDPPTGQFTGTDSQNQYEFQFPHQFAFGGYFAFGAAIAAIQMEPSGYHFVGHAPPGSALAVPAGNVSGAGGMVLATYYTVNGFTTDVLPVLTPGAPGWTIRLFIACLADKHNFLLISYDSSNAYVHLVNLDSSSGTCSETWRYTFPLAIMSTAPFSSLVEGVNQGCLESDLTHFWVHVASGNSGTIYRCTVTPTSLTVDASASAWTDATVTKNYAAIYADQGVAYLFQGDKAVAWSIIGMGPIQPIALSLVLTDLSERSGVQAANINATALASTNIWGFVVDRQMNARAAMEALAPAYWFDAVESDTKLKFVPRSAAAVATIVLNDMGADTSGKASTSPLTFTRGSEIELPTQVSLLYYAVGAMYQAGMQYARRVSRFETHQIMNVDSSAVMDDTQAAIAADVILWDTLAGRVLFKFSTPTKLSTGSVPAAQLEPTDIVNIVTANESYLARITRKTEQGGKIDWEAVACAPVYSQFASGGAISADQGVSSSPGTNLQIMDIPPLRDADGSAANLYVAMYGATGWPGAELFKSNDGGATWAPGVTQSIPGTAGAATTALGDFHTGNIFDESSVVQVNVNVGATLSSASELSVLNGANAALIGTEIVQFKNATLISGTTYALSGLLRGRFGTEGAMAGHGIGDRFVLLTGVIVIQGTTTADIGQSRQYEAVTVGQALGSGSPQTIIEVARTLQCFSPVHLGAYNAATTNDIELIWVRRNRITWQWLPAVDEPMSEATEAYLVSIFNGSTVVRTISVGAVQTAAYTAAQQITDFGSSQSTIKFGVQQISAVTGPGVMAIATIVLPSRAITYIQALSASVSSSATLGKSYIQPKALSASASTAATLATSVVQVSTSLLHFDGTNGSTTFTDVYGLTWSAGGTAQLSTAQFEFGTASLYCGSGTGYITTSGTPFHRGSGDWTYECWFNLTANSQWNAPFSRRNGDSDFAGVLLLVNKSTNLLNAVCSNDGTAWQVSLSGVTTIGTGVWHHVAFVRHGNVFTVYLDGVSEATTTVALGSVFEDGTTQNIGAMAAVADLLFYGYIDEARVSPVARYTSNFTPTGPFTI